jgi:hypothetical protein
MRSPYKKNNTNHRKEVSPYNDQTSSKPMDGAKLTDKSRSGKSIVLDYT